MKLMLRDWWDRYSLPFFVATVLTVVGANIGMLLFDNLVAAAFIGTWSDNISFYGMIAYRDMKKRKTVKGYLKVFRNLVIEFGAAEYLDSFVFRPFYLSVFPLFISNYSLAIILGGLVAEITYFVPVLISYEGRKKYLS